MTTTHPSFPSWRDYAACDHAVSEVRWRVRRNAIGCWVVQCLLCGRELRAVAKTAPEVLKLNQVVPFDEGLATRIESRIRDRREQEQREQIEAREQQDAEWWEWYDRYLKTPEWQAKRLLVFERANGICEGCRRHKALQVHHLTYEHAGDEFLFELVAVCNICHQRIHPHME